MPFLAACRITAGAAALVGPKGKLWVGGPWASEAALALAFALLHLWRWGRPPLGPAFGAVDFFYEDCKVRAYRSPRH